MKIFTHSTKGIFLTAPLILCKTKLQDMKKKMLILSAFVLAGICIVNAQQEKKKEGPRKPPTVEERLKHVREVMGKDGQLKEDKQNKVAEVFKQFFVKMDKLVPPPPPPPNKEEMDKLVKERDEAIAKILSPEEFKRFKELEKKFRPPHPPHKEGEDGPPPPKD